MKDNVDALEQVRNTAIDLGMKFGPKLLTAIIIIVIGVFVARWAAGVTDRILKRFEFEPPVQQLLLTIVRGDLVQDWRARLPQDPPNYFFVNIAGEEREAEMGDDHCLRLGQVELHWGTEASRSVTQSECGPLGVVARREEGLPGEIGVAIAVEVTHGEADEVRVVARPSGRLEGTASVIPTDGNDLVRKVAAQLVERQLRGDEVEVPIGFDVRDPQVGENGDVPAGNGQAAAPHRAGVPALRR